MNENIIDVNACYKTIDDNRVQVIFEVIYENHYETILSYDFSLKDATCNSIKAYKDLDLKQIYQLYNFVKDNPIYKGIFDIYFRVYQNDINNLRAFAINKMNEVNNPVEEKRGLFDGIKNQTKTFFQELMVEGSSNELYNTISRVAAYKKECPIEKIGEFPNRYSIDIIRYKTDIWEPIYSYECGKYKTGVEMSEVDSVSVYKKLSEEEIFKILSMLNTNEELDVMQHYLKTYPKEPHGEIIFKNEEKTEEIQNIKFL